MFITNGFILKVNNFIKIAPFTSSQVTLLRHVYLFCILITSYAILNFVRSKHKGTRKFFRALYLWKQYLGNSEDLLAVVTEDDVKQTILSLFCRVFSAAEQGRIVVVQFVLRQVQTIPETPEQYFVTHIHCTTGTEIQDLELL